MKRIIRYIVMVMPIVLAFGCTDIMDDMNNDPKSITSEKGTADSWVYKQHIVNMEKNLFNLTSSWQYQVQQNLNADIFAGYTMHPGSFNTTTTNDNYNWNPGWNGWAFTVAQTNLTDFLSLKTLISDGKTYSDFYSYGLILKVLTALPLVDGFGPFPYLNYGVGINPEFDNVDVIYKQGLIPDLTKAIDTLMKYADSPEADRVKNSGADISTLGGDITNWIKLANTLKLRLAIRISDVAASDADKYIKETLSNPNGFLDETTGDFAINWAANNLNNPFSFISVAWSDCVMNADMQSFLEGFNDPRIDKYFSPATSDVVTTAGAVYAGVRSGVALTADKGEYAGYSKLVITTNFMLVSGAESYFLLAEAAQKAIGGVTGAQDYYENGVKASFNLRGLSEVQAESYLMSTLTPADYVDYSSSTNNYTATTTITPQWDASNAIEQIITQKWIAIFPQGAEAWAEFRRTDFPKLIIPKNMADGPNFDNTINQGEFLKRMPYPSNIIAISSEEAAKAITSYLNGQDNGAQKLWWDTN